MLNCVGGCMRLGNYFWLIFQFLINQLFYGVSLDLLKEFFCILSEYGINDREDILLYLKSFQFCLILFKIKRICFFK